jgi:alanyl-tRNA synthetase
MTSTRIENISADTHVTFPQNSTKEISPIIWSGICAVSDGTESGVLITETTPFHPLDPTWPDQPGDTGVIEVGGRSFQVSDSLTAAVSKEDGSLFFGRSIPARRGSSDWSFVVAHIIADASQEDLLPLAGENALLQVDEDRRKLLSALHTSCHVMALALNASTKHLWHKDVVLDSLGSPNFDQLAIEESKITTEASFDRYRVGKSLRKKGIDTGALLEDLGAVMERTGETLREWLKSSSPVTIEAPDGKLSEVRVWKCALSAGTASLPCGGTHLKNLQELEAAEVSVSVSETDPEFTVRTAPRLKYPPSN